MLAALPSSMAISIFCLLNFVLCYFCYHPLRNKCIYTGTDVPMHMCIHTRKTAPVTVYTKNSSTSCCIAETTQQTAAVYLQIYRRLRVRTSRFIILFSHDEEEGSVDHLFKISLCIYMILVCTNICDRD